MIQILDYLGKRREGNDSPYQHVLQRIPSDFETCHIITHLRDLCPE